MTEPKKTEIEIETNPIVEFEDKLEASLSKILCKDFVGHLDKTNEEGVMNLFNSKNKGLAKKVEDKLKELINNKLNDINDKNSDLHTLMVKMFHKIKEEEPEKQT